MAAEIKLHSLNYGYEKKDKLTVQKSEGLFAALFIAINYFSNRQTLCSIKNNLEFTKPAYIVFS
jgi:hypothetical protein